MFQTILTYENETISDTKQIDLSKSYSGISPVLRATEIINSVIYNSTRVFVIIAACLVVVCAIMTGNACHFSDTLYRNILIYMLHIICIMAYGPWDMMIIIESYDLCFTFNLQSTGTFKVFEAEFKNGQTGCRISKSKYSVSLHTLNRLKSFFSTSGHQFTKLGWENQKFDVKQFQACKVYFLTASETQSLKLNH